MTAKPRKTAKSEPAKPLKEKRPRGRPPVYKPEFCEIATNYCLLGYTNQELATLFRVSDFAIEQWLRSKPDFASAVKAGRGEADNAVSKSLYQRALSGDVTACIFWLKNRQRRDWREKHEVHNTNTTDTKVTFTLSPEAKAHLEEVRRLLGPDPSHADASASASPAGGEAGNGKAEGNGSVH